MSFRGTAAAKAPQVLSVTGDAQAEWRDPQPFRGVGVRDDGGIVLAVSTRTMLRGTDKSGFYSFDTIKPGSVPDADGKPQAPHIVLAVFARGMLLHLYTRIYFEDEAGNAGDAVLALVPAGRRATLIARRKAGAGSRPKLLNW